MRNQVVSKALTRPVVRNRRHGPAAAANLRRHIWPQTNARITWHRQHPSPAGVDEQRIVGDQSPAEPAKPRGQRRFAFARTGKKGDRAAGRRDRAGMKHDPALRAEQERQYLIEPEVPDRRSWCAWTRVAGRIAPGGTDRKVGQPGEAEHDRVVACADEQPRSTTRQHPVRRPPDRLGPNAWATIEPEPEHAARPRCPRQLRKRNVAP